MQRLLLLFLTCISLWGCITEYQAKGVESIDDLLVVEGIITNITTTITLTRGSGLADIVNSSIYVDDATLYVECDDGSRLPSAPIGQGKYRVATGQLNPGLNYRVNIRYNGEEYLSGYLSPLFTPEIDSISWFKKGPGKPVHVCVSTHDPKDQSPYYLWSYTEDWEVTAPLLAQVYTNAEGVNVPNDLSTSSNRYYCWASGKSRSLLLASSDKLSENRISGNTLVQVNPDDDRMLELYRISVKQNMVRKEAYRYFSNLQKNAELTGSIFSPIPSEMKGNITCTSNPDKLAVGYVEVSTTTQKSRFIAGGKEGLYELSELRTSCPHDTDGTKWENWEIYLLTPVLYAPRACVDCRVRGSKIRPADWPNDHY